MHWSMAISALHPQIYSGKQFKGLALTNDVDDAKDQPILAEEGEEGPILVS